MKLKRIASAVMAAVMAVTSAVVCEVTANAADDVTLLTTTVAGGKSVKIVYDISSDDFVAWDACNLIINTWDNDTYNPTTGSNGIGDYIKYGIGGADQAQYYDSGKFVTVSAAETDQELVIDLVQNPKDNFQVITNEVSGHYDLFISHVYVYDTAGGTGTVLYTWDNPALDSTVYGRYTLDVPAEGTIFPGTFDSTKISGPNSGIEVKLDITGAWGGLIFRPLAADGENLDANVALATYQKSDATTGEFTKFVKFSDFPSVPEKFGFDLWGATITSITIVNNSEVGTIYTSSIAATGVTLNKTTLTLEEGKSETLTATVAPNDASDKTVTWSSDATTVATVDENGKVTAVKEGTAIITATTANGKEATCTVEVTAIPVKTVTITKPAQTTYKVGDTVTLTAAVNSDATVADKEIVWSSSDSKIATVDETTGKVEFKAEGDVTITAAYKSDATIKDTVKLSATNVDIPVSSVTITAPTKTTYSIGETVTLTANVNSDATVADKEIVWSSSDDTIATVNETTGKVEFKAEGDVTITAAYKSDNTIKDTITLSVTASLIPVSSVTIVAPGYTVYTVGDPLTLTASVNSDATVTDKDIIWSSSDESIATIDENTGVVTFITNGKVTFTASYKSDISISDSITISVVAADYVESTIEYNKTATTPTNINYGNSDKAVYVMAISKADAEASSSVKVTITADGKTFTKSITTVYKQFKFVTKNGDKFIETGADGTYFAIIRIDGISTVKNLSVAMELVK